MPPEQKPNYDFLNTPPPIKKRFGLPVSLEHFSGIGLITLMVLVLIILMIVLFGGSSGTYKNEVDIIARGQEIIRVSALATQETQDQNLKDLAATVSVSITSQQDKLVSYLGSHGKKITPASKALYKNSSTDSQLTSAMQAGNLFQVYKDYLKTSLGSYQNSLQMAYKTAKASEKSLLTEDYTANTAILSAL